MDFDLTSFAGIAAATTAAVTGLRRAFPQLQGREELMALVIPLALGVVAKLGGAFEAMQWGNFVTMLLLSGLTAQVGHDKLVVPVDAEVKKALKKKEDAEQTA